MKRIYHKELKKVIKIVYDRKLPFMLWGTFGIGKSQIIKEMAKDMDLNFVDVRISQLEPSDLRGLPKLDGDTTRWLSPDWLPKDKESKGILFFDEINLAPPSIQASCYQLILDRQLGEYKLPDGWIILSAGNRIEDKANVFELPAPLSNRFLHLELNIPTIDDWTDWGFENGNDIDNRIISFLHFKPSRIHSFDNKNKDRAIATPRTWEYCSKLIKDETDYNVLTTLSSSAIGEAVAIEFMGFLKLERQIDVEKLLENPESVKEIKEIDLKYSVLSTISEHFKKNKKPETLKKVIMVCSFMEAEFSVLLLRLIKAIDKNFFTKEAVKIKEFTALAKLSAKYLL
tara:strand:+ start:117 stop:1145 length:1029 start_codon:yes stop_codon:yes gene_type:complete